ncbi:MAG: Smr/MutS family protein [Candidatus Aminicenantales bacterium]
MPKIPASPSANPKGEASPVADDDAVEMPIDGVLDLHTFSPKDVKDLVPEYIGECLNRGITEIRIIHGKGTGILKAIVQSVLKKDPRVASFKDAGIDAGGWGATLVRLVTHN